MTETMLSCLEVCHSSSASNWERALNHFEGTFGKHGRAEMRLMLRASLARQASSAPMIAPRQINPQISEKCGAGAWLDAGGSVCVCPGILGVHEYCLVSPLGRTGLGRVADEVMADHFGPIL